MASLQDEVIVEDIYGEDDEEVKVESVHDGLSVPKMVTENESQLPLRSDQGKGDQPGRDETYLSSTVDEFSIDFRN